jgi:hypothetical protein
MRAKFWLESLKRKACSEDLGVDGNIILKRVLKAIVLGDMDWIYLAQNGTCSGLLQKLQFTFGLHKTRGISQVILRCMDLFMYCICKY